MLTTLISRAKENNLIMGVVPHLVDGGLSVLQYADDTILFMDHNLQQAKNLKLILCFFEQLSGLTIYFHKSELYCFGKAQEAQEEYKTLFGCNIGSLPFRYLGIPIHHRRLRNAYWKGVEDWFERKLSTWKCKNLSTGGV